MGENSRDGKEFKQRTQEKVKQTFTIRNPQPETKKQIMDIIISLEEFY